MTWCKRSPTPELSASAGLKRLETSSPSGSRKAGWEPALARHHLPLISGYCTLNLIDSTKRKDEMDKAVAWAKLIKKYNGRIFVLGPNQVKRDEYVFAANKANIVSTLNDAAKAVTDQGLTVALHQHTAPA